MAFANAASLSVCLLVIAFVSATKSAPTEPPTTTAEPSEEITCNATKLAFGRATTLLDSLSTEVKKVLESAADATEATIASYTAEVTDEHREQKFSSVLRDLEDLEAHIQTTIRNLTATRQFAYGAMLRPMVTHIQQLRTNLTLLRNRMVGIVALNTIAQQVNSLTSEIGDAITTIDTPRDPPTLLNANGDESDDNELKDLQESLGWVTE